MTANTGHGHVTPRPDGARARCGGPVYCHVCQQERAALEASKRPASAADVETVKPAKGMPDAGNPLLQRLINSITVDDALA